MIKILKLARANRNNGMKNTKAVREAMFILAPNNFTNNLYQSILINLDNDLENKPGLI